MLINNNGGGIFEMLPVAHFDPPFEEFFAPPQSIDFAKLCATYDVDHEAIGNSCAIARRDCLPYNGYQLLNWVEGNEFC